MVCFQGESKIGETHKGYQEVRRGWKFGDSYGRIPKDALHNREQDNGYPWLLKWTKDPPERMILILSGEGVSGDLISPPIHKTRTVIGQFLDFFYFQKTNRNKKVVKLKKHIFPLYLILWITKSNCIKRKRFIAIASVVF